jgi:hypothetical protein
VLQGAPPAERGLAQRLTSVNALDHQQS